jgi:hypothetical protein
MARSTILQEVNALEVVHPEEEVVLENLLVSLPIHGDTLHQRIHATSSTCRKAAPNHDRLLVKIF